MLVYGFNVRFLRIGVTFGVRVVMSKVNELTRRDSAD
jgi:hypothetical protein